jgi:ABC-type branched-subunit amino acid transport system ATPase component
MSLLEVKNTSKNFSGIKALDDFSCKVKRGQIVGLIGPNGAGKSTLFNVITGFIPGDNGQIYFNKHDITGKPPYYVNKHGVSRTFQDLRLIEQITVLDNVLLAFKKQPGESFFNVLFNTRKTSAAEKENINQAKYLLENAGLKDKINDLAGNMSYGQQKLLSIVCCLAADADLLLLDEPVAGINPALAEKILTIIKDLPKQGKAVMLIEHDMEAITRICDWLIFMDAGKKISEGLPEEVRNSQQAIDAYIGTKIKHQ